MTEPPAFDPTTATREPRIEPRPPGSPHPWRVFAFLTPIVAVLMVIASIAGYAYGRPAGRAHVREELAQKSRDGVRTPVPRPTKLAPEPFVSSMPRPTATQLNSTAEPVTVVGPSFDAQQHTRKLSPNLPFSFRAPAGRWATSTPTPGEDIAYAEAFSRPTGTESRNTSPLRAMFAWRTCGRCAAADIPAFDVRFHRHYRTPPFHLKKKTSHTSFTEITDATKYHLVVRRLFEGADGRTYLVDYMTEAPIADKRGAQELANEILTQTNT